MLKTSPSTPLFQTYLTTWPSNYHAVKSLSLFFNRLFYTFKPYHGVKEGNLASNKDFFVIPRVVNVRKNMRYRFACEAR